MVDDALYEKWGNKVITGEEKVGKPSLLGFINTVEAIELLHKHIEAKSKIAVHCDVDVDGIGSGYIMKQLIGELTSTRQLYVINSDKVHGVQEKHAQFFNANPVDLLIIVDSGSNDIDVIKQMQCDVLVIDHHEVNHIEFTGQTNDGEHTFIIVNNTISNNQTAVIDKWLQSKTNSKAERINEYTHEDRMSCGLVVYELLRIYCLAYDMGDFLENKILYQWVGVTLFTDAIILNTMRNQWYIEKTVHSNLVETTLSTMMGELNRFQVSLSKSMIGYTIAPTINRAIRAGASGEALQVVLDKPTMVSSLQKYRQIQDDSVALGLVDYRFGPSYILKCIDGTGISKNYCGVIGSKLSGLFNRNVIVYRVTNGLAEGSFRGRQTTADYIRYFNNYDETTWAQGHKAAFGFKAPVGKLDDIMKSLEAAEAAEADGYYLTAGNVPLASRGIFHIDSMEEFKKAGGLWKLSIGNSKVSSDEQITITVHSSDVTLKEIHGKLFIYDVLGLECKAFKEIDTEYVGVYAEFNKTIDIFIK